MTAAAADEARDRANAEDYAHNCQRFVQREGEHISDRSCDRDDAYEEGAEVDLFGERAISGKDVYAGEAKKENDKRGED